MVGNTLIQKEIGQIGTHSMLNKTEYYDEFLRYFEMAKWQHNNCNLGTVPHKDSPFDDDLMKHVTLYDVVERKYAGFSQLLLDLWYDMDIHPYKNKLTANRKYIIHTVNTYTWGSIEWLYVFFVHRLTGSGINYSLSETGYHNSVLPSFTNCKVIWDIVDKVKSFQGPMYTSIGYQIAPFPKPKDGYKRGGDYFICKILPELVRMFNAFLTERKHTFRECMDWLEAYNKSLGIRVFYFQYGAVLADIADFFPNVIDKESHFFYGKNATECLSYLFEKPKGMKQLEFLDAVTDRIKEDTGMLPYNSEDVACDFIRWVENYINTKGDYSHLCLDSIWSSHRIHDHPFGRQKPMLKLGLVDTFNGKPHPSDDKIIKEANLTIEEYKNALI